MGCAENSVDAGEMRVKRGWRADQVDNADSWYQTWQPTVARMEGVP